MEQGKENEEARGANAEEPVGSGMAEEGKEVREGIHHAVGSSWWEDGSQFNNGETVAMLAATAVVAGVAGVALGRLSKR